MAPLPRTVRTPKTRARKPKDWAPTFLAALSETHLVTESAKRAGVHRQRAYERRESDLEFAREWSEVEERSTELLEREAYRRAAVGTEKPVYQGGELVGQVKEYSDTLLIFLLKSRRPDTYRDNVRHEVGGIEGKPIAAEIVTADAKEVADAAHEFLAKLSGSQS